MQRKMVVLLFSALALLSLGAWSLRASAQQPSPALALAGRTNGPGPNRVDGPARSDTSPPLRTLRPIPPATTRLQEAPENPTIPLVGNIPKGPDAVLQRAFGPLAMPAPIQNFEGQPNLWSVFPPDT